MIKSFAPLKGLKVVELGTYVAAPSLGFMLSLLGAEVIKVEPVGGDITREVTPWSWLNYNSSKESLCLDLKSRQGVDVFKRLAKSVDVVVDGLGPGVTDRLGVGFMKLSRLNTGLIYCSIKGFSSKGPDAKRAAFDSIAQAEAGLMYVTMSGGESRPTRVGNPCVDLSAAAFGVIGILSALLDGKKHASYIEVPLFDFVAFWNSYWLPYIQISGKQPSNLGTEHPGYSPYGVYRCSDGFVFIGVLNDKHWERLVERLGLQKELSPKTKTHERIAARSTIDSIIERAVERIPRRSVIAALGDAVPCAEVRDLESLLQSEELKGNERFVNVMSDGAGKVNVFLPPIGVTASKNMRVPRQGEHTEKILKRLGYSGKDIHIMLENRVVS
ncbi:MAG: CoA transferase [Nitrososphaerota archaeon]|jgi:crotonobetainyl-CoA:carnitine CoA-transferase CaiB-like acyl-CoA transferase|nr:CoA transferase [Nitrososphaerota archaeon]